MSAVWRASRAAVRRRRLQTIVIGVVTGLSTLMVVVALGLLAASAGPFDQAYARQDGAHLVAAYDRAKVTDAQLAAAARRPEVAAQAGPFGQATLGFVIEPGRPARQLTVVGRADPGGPVDRLNVWQGRWATGPGEVVLSRNPVEPPPVPLGAPVTAGGRSLTVVGYAYSVGGSAEAWVAPAQMATLRPDTVQVLYRFTRAATEAQVAAGQAAVTAGLAPGALLAGRSYLVLRAWAAASAGTFVPFLVVFGCLALAVAVLIVANVVSGAVVAGFRHIGVLKALGFTPGQVMTVYLAMVSIPAVAGCLAGTVFGNLLARTLLTNAFQNYGTGGIGVAPWVNVVTLLGMPALVALCALVPALRARSLSAAEAISAGSAPHAGRGLRIQRRLGGTRLPRAVSLGLGLPFARPARSVLTMAAVVLGVTSVTFAIGLAGTVTSYQKSQGRADAVQVEVLTAGGPGGTRTAAADRADAATLRSVPGAAQVTARADLVVRAAGSTQTFMAMFYRGDPGFETLSGRWPAAAGEIAVSERFLLQRGYSVGDSLTLESEGVRRPVRIVGKVLMNTGNVALAGWPTLELFAPGTGADAYEVRLTAGTGAQAYAVAVHAADPGLDATPTDNADSFVAVIIATVTLLTLMLGAVAALGVLNTAVLNTRERSRDLGMLKSIGMTPRQVVLMVVTSMAALGALGGVLGIPVGIVAHRFAMPAMAHAAQVAFPDRALDVYHPPVLALLVLAGVAIAALGAFLPARAAARLTIAKVLHNE